MVSKPASSGRRMPAQATNERARLNMLGLNVVDGIALLFRGVVARHALPVDPGVGHYLHQHVAQIRPPFNQ